MARIFFIAIAFYLVYKLVFELIIPIFKTTHHMRKQFRDMQNGGAGQPFQNARAEKEQQAPRKQPTGDYIDFEEVK
jgi:hypothetical protein